MLPFIGDTEALRARVVRVCALLSALITASAPAGTTQRSWVLMPETVLEGTGPHTATVRLTSAPTAALTLNLTASPAGQLSLPQTVTVPAGQTSAEFSFSVVNDDVVNLDRFVSVQATAPGVESDSGGTTIYDDDAPVPMLSVPAQLPENGSGSTPNATVTIDRAAPRSLTFWLTSDPTSTLAHPFSVTIPAGQAQVTFVTYGWNNDFVDGDLVVTLRASATGLADASASLVLTDNEPRTLTVTLPSSVQENSPATGTVSLTGKTRAALGVTLSNSNPSAVTVPLSVTIPAGASFVTFPITPINNSVRDGGRAVTITPQADTFISVAGTTTVRDDEVAAYQITPPSDVVNIGAPVPIALSAVNSEGRPVGGLSHAVNLYLVFADGSTQPASPPTVTLNGTITNVNLSLPPSIRPPFRIRASDANGVSGESQMLDTIRFVNLLAADLVWDAVRNRIYASIPSSAGGTYANHVVAIDPATAQVTRSVATGQNPTRLALTSGGEALYVGLNANGSLARIDPETMTIVSSFSLGNVNGYALQARDICPIPGSPLSVIVARGSSASSAAVYPAAVFDNGVQRPNTVVLRAIEPSPDPTLFFGDSPEGGVSHVRLDSNGLYSTAFQKFGLFEEMIADGSAIFSSWNSIDGANLKFTGSFYSDTSFIFRAVRPELSRHRVYFAESSPGSSGTISYLTAYNPTTFLPIRRASIPRVDSTQTLIRWGTNGLAFRASHDFAEKIAIANASQLVPVDAPANLRVALQAAPNPAPAGTPITYRIDIANDGPNIARTAFVTATLSDGQLLQTADATSGAPSVSGPVVKLAIGDLPAGGSVVMTITAMPQGARRSVSCAVDAWTSSVDPVSSDNVAKTIVPVGFSSARNEVNQLGLAVNNLAYDETRERLWATVPPAEGAPFGRALVWIDPVTGDVSAPIPLRGNPTINCMALSRNGRYLYIGLSDVPEVHRVDLDSAAYESARIPLGLEQGGSAATYARDIEALEGDGTSFIISTTWDHAAAVYDGQVRRPVRTGGVVAQRLERTASPNVFVSNASNSLSRLLVSPSGVSVSASASQVVGSSSTFEMRSSGNLLLTSLGGLLDSSTLTPKASFSPYGAPCLDTPNRRAYFVSGTALYAFDPYTKQPAGNLPLPDTPTNSFADWAQSCVRWGAEGFAITGAGKIYLARWSGAVPPDVDVDGDGIADAWEAEHFGTLKFDASADGDRDGLTNAFEYLFASSPMRSNGSALRTRVTRENGGTFLHLMYPRRQQRITASYAYEVSTDLAEWEPAQNVAETILGTSVVDGVQVELVDARVPAPDSVAAFARLRWLSP